MEKKIPWFKIAVAAAVVASAAVGIALFIKKKLDDLKYKEDEYDLFDDECEFCDSYNPMDEVMTQEESEEDTDFVEEQPIEDDANSVEDTFEENEYSEEEKEI